VVRRGANMRGLSNRKKEKVVLAAGVFDLLHIGHVKFLEEAKKAGGKNSELIVIVARDSTVEKRKGERPVVPEAQRRALVEALKVVDTALLGYEEFNMEKVIEKIMPDVIAVGYDQKGIEEELRKIIQKKGLEIEIVRIDKFEIDEINSSSDIKRKIIESFKR
jgi:FAD synthetase